jgi:hypothetical protein
MAQPPTHEQTGTGLPAHVAAEVRQLAERLHDVLHDEMVHPNPAPEVTLLWQAAKLINTAAGGLDYDTDLPATRRHAVRWSDVAAEASDVGDAALGIAAAEMSPADAAGHVERADVDALDVPDAPALAFAAIVKLTPPLDVDARPLAVAIADDPARTLTIADQPGPHPYTAAQLLRVAHHLHRLGGALGDVLSDDVLGDVVTEPAGNRLGSGTHD